MKKRFLLLIVCCTLLMGNFSAFAEAITVYLQKPSWSTVNFYSWIEDQGELLGKWPGTPITKTVSYDGKEWYAYTFPEEYQDLNIIFNNGEDQTVDIFHIQESIYFRLDSETGTNITVTDVYGSFSGGSYTNAWPEQYTGVMLQGFYWDSFAESKWTYLTEQATELSSYFDLIWVPNSGKAANNPSMGYDPVYWMSNHNSSFGTESELRTMIQTYKELGTGIIEDVVINHRSGATNWTDFPTETYKGVTYEWGPWAICSTDEVKDAPGQERPTGAPDTGDDFNGSRDLDHTNEKVQAGVKAYLDYLKNDLGYAGWRYDMVKGYNPYYVGMYNMSAGNRFSVGEYWDNYDNITNWIQGTRMNSAAFDFPFKYAVNEAFHSNDMTKLVWKRNGELDQPAGLIHMDTYTRYAVTFIDNHDTYREDYNRMNGDVVRANAYMLMMPGTPCVFYKHWLDHKDAIGRLIDIRKAVGVHNQSEVKVLHLTNGCFCAEVTGLNGKVAVKIGPDMYTPEGYGESDLKAFGDGYAVWTKVNVAKQAVTMSPEPGYYEGGVTVTLNLENGEQGTKIAYTTDGSVPSASNGTQVEPGYQIQVSGKMTIKAVAVKDGKEVSRVVSGTYKTELNPITVYLEKPEWSVVNYYAWLSDADHTIVLGNWPGTAMTETKTIAGREWFYYTFPGEYDNINVIFNNGTDQTVDISNITEDAYFCLDSFSGKTITVTDVTDSMSGSVVTPVEAVVSVYPNPVADYLTVKVDGVERLEIFTLSGALAKSVENTNVCDASGLSRGVYFYRVLLTDGSVCHGKFLKK